MTKFKKIIVSFIALVLTGVITFSGMGVNAFAEDVTVPAEETVAEETVATEDEEEVTTEAPEAFEETEAVETEALETKAEETAMEVTEEEAETEAVVVSEETVEAEDEVTLNDEMAAAELIAGDTRFISRESDTAKVPELVAATATEEGIVIEWKAVSNASMYRLYRKESGDSNWSGYTWIRGGATSFLDKNVETGKGYYYTLRAVYENGEVSRFNENGAYAELKVASTWVLSLPQDVYQHTGNERKPTLTVTDGDTVLTEGKDYEVKYENNTDPGTATVTATGIGGYRGSKQITFEIVMKQAKISTIAVDGSKIHIAWNEVPGTDKYCIFYRVQGSDKWKYYQYVDPAYTEYWLENFQPGIRFEFTVRSFHSNGKFSALETSPKSIVINKPVLRKVNDNWWLYGTNGLIDNSYNGFFTDEDGTFNIKNGLLVESVSADRLAMYKRAQYYDSATYYLILVNRSTHRVGIYYWGNGKWEENRYIMCGDGAYYTPTVEGVFSILNQAYYFDSDNVRCFYASRFYADYWLHSILYAQTYTPQSVIDPSLGVAVSHGCVRMALENAKFIYDNCAPGTTVVVYH